MAVNEFENFEYDFAKKQNEQKQKFIKYGLFAVGGIILIFTCVGFFSSLNLFSSTTTQVSQPIQDPNTAEQIIKEENQKTIDAYANVKIPYRDPKGRFQIDFSTPYVSDRIVVYILKPENRDDTIREATDIINTARKTVTISSVIYKNSY